MKRLLQVVSEGAGKPKNWQLFCRDHPIIIGVNALQTSRLLYTQNTALLQLLHDRYKLIYSAETRNSHTTEYIVTNYFVHSCISSWVYSVAANHLLLVILYSLKQRAHTHTIVYYHLSLPTIHLVYILQCKLFHLFILQCKLFLLPFHLSRNVSDWLNTVLHDFFMQHMAPTAIKT